MSKRLSLLSVYVKALYKYYNNTSIDMTSYEQS